MHDQCYNCCTPSTRCCLLCIAKLSRKILIPAIYKSSPGQIQLDIVVIIPSPASSLLRMPTIQSMVTSTGPTQATLLLIAEQASVAIARVDPEVCSLYWARVLYISREGPFPRMQAVSLTSSKFSAITPRQPRVSPPAALVSIRNSHPQQSA